MSSTLRYDFGLWNAICDQCGRQFKSNELRLRWDNLMVCQEDYEPRQPQDYVHGVADIQAPPWTRPESSDLFSYICDLVSINGVADYGTADCAAANKDNGNRPVCTLEGSFALPGYGTPGCMIPSKIVGGLNDFLIG